eukprot:517873-Rhodomonas_salina.1
MVLIWTWLRQASRQSDKWKEAVASIAGLANTFDTQYLHVRSASDGADGDGQALPRSARGNEQLASCTFQPAATPAERTCFCPPRMMPRIREWRVEEGGGPGSAQRRGAA